MTRRLTIVVENKHCAFVNGYGSRDLLTELRGAPPMWSPISRAWVTTEAIARDLVVLAEHRGFDILMTGGTGGPPARDLAPVTPVTPETTAPVPESALW